MEDKFVFGNSYRDAHLSKISQSIEDSEKICSWTKNPTDILVFSGNVGTGKTYFCAAFYNSLLEKKKNVRAYSEAGFFEDLRYQINQGWDAVMRVHKICDADFVILDDMCSCSMTEWQKDMLNTFVDCRFSNGLPTVIATNLTKHQINEKFHPRFCSRLFAEKNTKIDLSNGIDRRSIKFVV